jgi:hypothetical protein
MSGAMAFLEPRLDQAKVQLLERIAAELQVEAGVVADLEEVCRGHVLRAFGDMYRRTFAALNNDGVVQGYARFILPMLGVSIDRQLRGGPACLLPAQRLSLPRPSPGPCSAVRPQPAGPAMSTETSGPGSTAP